MTSLAMMHLADKEDEEAARWFRRGAEAGDFAAQQDYALLLLQGRGVIKDEQAAACWYRLLELAPRWDLHARLRARESKKVS